MSWTDVLDNMAATAERALGGRNHGDYVKDGLLYCGKCKTNKQTRITLFGKTRIVRCTCRCEQEQEAMEEAARKDTTRRLEAARNRQAGFPHSDMGDWTFAADDGKDAATTRIAKAYVAHFRAMRDKGRGLLLYGPCGTGKTYAAACIANALIDQGYPCLVTNFARISNTVSGMRDGRQQYLDSLNRYDLLVLDDLGAERTTEYMTEMVFNIVDARYRAGLPMIVTSNLTLDELLHPASVTEQRIYSRVLERCHPVEVIGADRRQRKIMESHAEMRKLLGLEDGA